MPAPTIDAIELADEPSRWAALGFEVEQDSCQIGTVRLRYTGAREQAGTNAGVAGEAGSPMAPSGGIVGWSLRDIEGAQLDGLPTSISADPMPSPAPAHANGVIAIDHVVAVSPDLDRSVAALQAAGLDLRRVREQPTPAGAPRQAFFRLGAEILELVQEPEEVIARHGGSDRPAHFWGLALLVADIDQAAASFAPHVSEVRDAVQPGRRITSVRRSAGLSIPLALMSAAGEGAG
jgi:Glyoxalase/Bleomycin resistance protein/Dioxygenase superfamily